MFEWHTDTDKDGIIEEAQSIGPDPSMQQIFGGIDGDIYENIID